MEANAIFLVSSCFSLIKVLWKIKAPIQINASGCPYPIWIPMFKVYGRFQRDGNFKRQCIDAYAKRVKQKCLLEHIYSEHILYTDQSNYLICSYGIHYSGIHNSITYKRYGTVPSKAGKCRQFCFHLLVRQDLSAKFT